MDKMRILELAEDARVSNADPIYQAKELGFYVQAYYQLNNNQNMTSSAHHVVYSASAVINIII